MNILLIGSGGREHALAWAIAASNLTNRLVIAPGSDAMAQIGTCVDIAADDQAALLARLAAVICAAAVDNDISASEQ